MIGPVQSSTGFDVIKIESIAAASGRSLADVRGEIVAAMLDGEATVKTFKRSDGHVWLIPHNPAYTPILGDEATILGRVVAVLRRV